jgi:hypothetical protein
MALTCTKASLTGSAASVFNVPANLSPKQYKALMIYALALQYAAITGGTNYLATLSTKLLSDAATMTCGMEQSDRDAAKLLIAFNGATAAGATVPSTVTDKLAACIKLTEATDDQLDQALVLLSCRLGKPASPQ